MPKTFSKQPRPVCLKNESGMSVSPVIYGLRVRWAGTPFLFPLRGCKLLGGMSAGSHGSASPLHSGVEGLFEGSEIFSESLVPSASLADTGDGSGGDTQQTGFQTVNFNHAVGAAWDSLSSSTVEPIWNTGFWRCIFGSETLGDVLPPQQFKRPLPVEHVAEEDAGDPEKRARAVASIPSSGPLFQACVKSTDDISWQEKREGLLQKALKHWLVIIEMWNFHVEFVACLNGCESVNAQLIMLGDVFRGKAPSTLNKRANSMKLLCHELHSMDLSFPCDEPALYAVLCGLRRDGAPPSRGKGILEAIAFVRYTMGILECDALLKGRRCWGAATSDEPIQRRQASPLLVKELEKLHHVLEHDMDIWNRMFSGTVLFMVYSRARWSDAQHGVKIFFDRSFGSCQFVEVLTGHHKTMRALQHRHQFLPLIAPGTGVTTQKWADIWMTVREELGVDFELGHALMPAPLPDGQPGRRALDSQEAGRWLRALLGADVEGDSERKISSHSLKCTMLSYLAKRGCEMSDRLLLGYHTSPFTMGLTYSRDGMARPLQILEDMLSEIRGGTFRPDETRSGRLVRQGAEAPRALASGAGRDGAVKVEISDEESEINAWDLIPMHESNTLPVDVPEHSDHDVNDACTETSSSEASDEGSSEPAFESKGKRIFEPPRAPEGFTLWQHSKSKILHLVNEKFPNVFECGRKPGAFHTCQDVRPRWDTGICWRCFKNR